MILLLLIISVYGNININESSSSFHNMKLDVKYEPVLHQQKVYYKKGLPFINNPLISLNGTELYIIPLSNADGEATSLAHDVAEYVLKISLPSSYEVVYNITGGKNLSAYIWTSKKGNYTLIVTSYGHVKFTRGDGRVNKLYLLNEFEIDNVIIRVNDSMPINWFENYISLGHEGIPVDIVFMSIGADIVEQTNITEYIVVNGTLTPVETPVLRFENPYYKFYFLIKRCSGGLPH
jgi:hypothetical protein